MISLVICFLICFCYIGLSYFFIDDKFYEQHYTILLIINFIAWIMGMICALAIVVQVGGYNV
jgi:hypothetical protein